jgi:Zn-dependent protease with chaperone function
MIGMSGAENWLHKVGLVREMADWMQPLIVAGAFFWVLLLFGFISRRFERQADVFAARTMQQQHLAAAATAPLPAADGTVTVALDALARADEALAHPRSHVGAYGATLFASALQRVAVINNMPTGPRARWAGGVRKRAGFILERLADLGQNWLHGSIDDRQAFLRRLSADPGLTLRFDRFMFHLYSTLLFLLAASGTFLWAVR